MQGTTGSRAVGGHFRILPTTVYKENTKTWHQNIWHQTRILWHWLKNRVLGFSLYKDFIFQSWQCKNQKIIDDSQNLSPSLLHLIHSCLQMSKRHLYLNMSVNVTCKTELITFRATPSALQDLSLRKIILSFTLCSLWHQSELKLINQ